MKHEYEGGETGEAAVVPPRWSAEDVQYVTVLSVMYGWRRQVKAVDLLLTKLGQK